MSPKQVVANANVTRPNQHWRASWGVTRRKWIFFGLALLWSNDSCHKAVLERLYVEYAKSRVFKSATLVVVDLLSWGALFFYLRWFVVQWHPHAMHAHCCVNTQADTKQVQWAEAWWTGKAWEASSSWAGVFVGVFVNLWASNLSLTILVVWKHGRYLINHLLFHKIAGTCTLCKLFRKQRIAKQVMKALIRHISLRASHPMTWIRG